MFSLGVGHCGVLNEGEVVGDILVVRQPPMGPNQAVLTHCHLVTNIMTQSVSEKYEITFIIIIILCIMRTSAHHSVRAPLGDEGMGLILWHHSLNQRHVVTDALQT